jgi:hypothetical protein
MGSLRTNADDHLGIIGNHLVVERQLGRAYKIGIAMVGFVIGGLAEDGRKGVYLIELIVGDHHEEGEYGFPDYKKVNVGRLPFKGGEEVMGLIEEASDHVGRHDGLVDYQLTPSEGGVNYLDFGAGWGP